MVQTNFPNTCIKPFNRKERKELNPKDAKCFDLSVQLCVLCVITLGVTEERALRTLRFISLYSATPVRNLSFCLLLSEGMQRGWPAIRKMQR